MTATQSPGLRKIRKTPGLSASLAKALRVTRQAVSDWTKVPVSRLIEVEEHTGIPREELRPELFKKPKRAKRK